MKFSNKDYYGSAKKTFYGFMIPHKVNPTQDVYFILKDDYCIVKVGSLNHSHPIFDGKYKDLILYLMEIK